mmetsp:Transcript_10167/g.24908  ORF Transcript_10167/g.24908 Transcript_10167/m.24908 type:complete len:200 (-) Transcript_10167:1856-2455(-)
MLSRARVASSDVATSQRTPSMTEPLLSVCNRQLVPRSLASCSFGSKTFGAESSLPEGLKSANCLSSLADAADCGNFMAACSSAFNHARRFGGAFSSLALTSLIWLLAQCFCSRSTATVVNVDMAAATFDDKYPLPAVPASWSLTRLRLAPSTFRCSERFADLQIPLALPSSPCLLLNGHLLDRPAIPLDFRRNLPSTEI